MARRLLTLLSAASLSLCATTCAAWAVSVAAPVDDVPLPGGWHASLRDRYFHAGRDGSATGGGFGLGPWAAGSAVIAAGVATLNGWTRRRAAPPDGRCPACGYDLRASLGRCPECGAEPKGADA